MSHEPVRKKRRLTAATANVPQTTSTLTSASDSDVDDLLDHSFAKHAARWDLEQEYERRPRKQKEKENLRLPIKTAEGWLQQVRAPLENNVDGEKDFSEDDLGEIEDDKISQDDKLHDRPSLSPREEILQAKEELARIAGLLNEDPEHHVSSLKTLTEITASENPTVVKLSLVTQMAVYKDILPGYRIRPLSEEDLKAKVSKDVRTLRNFEQSIVSNYQHYVKDLARIASINRASGFAQSAGLSSVALSCAGSMLTAAPHFNFRGDLLRILVDRLSLKDTGLDFVRAVQAIQKLLVEDDEGNASLEAVSILAKMIKAKNCRVHEQVLNLFLSLRLLSEFSQKASATKVDNDNGVEHSQKIKSSKKKREHRTKKERKIMRENKAIEREMKEADAVVSHEQRDNNQAETLKLVFGIYFRILKARTPNLIGPVLEGLVKYAHLINQDFFGDLLEALKDLTREYDNDSHGETNQVSSTNDDGNNETATRNMTRESLLCCITAFALLEGQDAAAAAKNLNLDLSFFITHLYQVLLPASLDAEVERSSKSLHLPDPHSSHNEQAANQAAKVNVQTTIVLLLRSLKSTLIPDSNPHSVPPVRLAAYIKQILIASLQLPEKSCTAMQGLIQQVVKTHKRKIATLWNTEERRGDGVFDPLRGTVEGSNPFASTVWEGELLRLHFAPHVRRGWAEVEKAVVD